MKKPRFSTQDLGTSPVWQRMRVMLSSGMRTQVTRSGLLFTVTILLLGLAAFASANNLLFLLLAAMLSTLLISGFISRLGLAGLELDFQLPEHISARRKISARIQIRNVKSWMPSFSIHLAGSERSGFGEALYFPVIPGGAAIEDMVEVCFARRGAYRENSFQFSTRFPFGFTERRIQVTLRRDVIVYPSVDPQAGLEELLTSLHGEIESHYRGRGHDFYRIRPYEALESARHVDWKATAHTRELQVREFAREQEHLVELFLDLNAGPQEAEWFETAVDCCAYLAWRVAGRGARVRLRTQEFDMRAPEDGDVYTILKYLALVAPRPGRAAVYPDDENSFQVVFTTSPERVLEAGWTGARMLGPDAFLAASGADAAGAGRAADPAIAHVDHRH